MGKFKPVGTLILIGGNEDKKNRKTILKRILKEAGSTNPQICIVTLASNISEKRIAAYTHAFDALGVNTLAAIHYEDIKEADTEKNLSAVEQADIVFFTGGDQRKLVRLISGTRLLEIIRTKYENNPGFTVAGTSAGAAAMPEKMIVAGKADDSCVKGEVELVQGLGLIQGLFIDTHFTERGRMGRLLQGVALNPKVLGIGLSEDTALIIQDEKMEVAGKGVSIIIDGSRISYTDINEVDNGHPVSVESVLLHIMNAGKVFLLGERKIASACKNRPLNPVV